MKKGLFVIFSIIWTFSYGQKLSVSKYLDNQKKILQLAQKYNDKEAYRTALYEILAVEKGRSTYKDTLARFYFNNGEFVSFLLVSNEILKQKPGDENLLLQQGVAYEKIGNLKKAVEKYEQVFEKQPQNVKLGYILAWTQYQLKRVDEAFGTLMKLQKLNFPDEKVILPGPNNQGETVPLKAAYFNLLGLVSYDLHNLPMAENYFGEALKIFPDFQSAKQNKEAIRIMIEKLKKDNKTDSTKQLKNQ